MEDIQPHQLARVQKEAAAVLVKFSPNLRPVLKEIETVNTLNYKKQLKVWLDRYGDQIAIPRMVEGEHKYIEPMTELAAMSKGGGREQTGGVRTIRA